MYCVLLLWYSQYWRITPFCSLSWRDSTSLPPAIFRGYNASNARRMQRKLSKGDASAILHVLLLREKDTDLSKSSEKDDAGVPRPEDEVGRSQLIFSRLISGLFASTCD